MNNLIELQDVNLIRNGKSLLKEINWQVKENECWAILGLNGAGKSTLLKLLMSEYWASSGQVTVLGTRFGEGGIPELRKRIGIVSSLYFRKTARASFDRTNCPNWSIQE